MANKYVSPSKLTLAVNKLKELITTKVSKTGDTMTGNLVVGSSKIGSNGYIEGTWLKTTNVTNKGSQTGKIAVIDTNGWIYYRTPGEIKAEMGISNIPTVFEKTITLGLGSSWSGTAAPYSQTVSVSGLLSSDSPIVDVITDLNNFKTQQEDWSKIFRAVSSSDKLTFYATDKTKSVLSVKVKVVR